MSLNPLHYRYLHADEDPETTAVTLRPCSDNVPARRAAPSVEPSHH